MGYAKDLGRGVVFDICAVTGYPRDKYGHLLRTLDTNEGKVIEDWMVPGTYLPNWTSPYGFLDFAIGNSKDFWCFDFKPINAGPRGHFVVLHAAAHGESGFNYLMDVQYRVLPANTYHERKLVVAAANEMREAALSWCAASRVVHDRAGWNQNDRHFPIAVAAALFPRINREEMAIRKHNTKAWNYILPLIESARSQGGGA